MQPSDPATRTASVYGGGVGGPSRPARVEAVTRGLTRRWVPRGVGAIAPIDGSLMEAVLAARGLGGTEAERFLAPTLTDLHDPSMMIDLDRAAMRVAAAAGSGERIVIYGDYDVDGITATAILVRVLRLAWPGCRVRTYIPHRLDEGYGLNAEALVELARAGTKVVVSVDCGVTAIEPARAARAAGLDLIITDHHTPPAREADLPEAFAVVHPTRPGSTYPFGELSGAGVAYKLAWRLATLAAGGARVDAETRRLLVDLLGFAALGAIADVVPLVGENRVLARHGLGRVRGSPFVGLTALVDASGLNGEKVDAFDVAFKLAPRLNACGRLGHAAAAVELFTTDDPERAAEIAAELTAQNNQRRNVEQAIAAEAMASAREEGMTGTDRRAIVLARDTWHAGVVGIVCSRMVEQFGRPTILLCGDGERLHGSGRSIDGFNLHGALAGCSDLLERFGGHEMAAGMTLRTDRLAAFVARFTEIANAAIAPEDLMPAVSFDATVRQSDLTSRAVAELAALAPFGRGNPGVVVAWRGVRLEAAPVAMGSTGDHLALTLREPGSERMTRVVAWRWAEHRARLVRGMDVDVLMKPKVSTWGGRANVEPELVDLAIRSPER